MEESEVIKEGISVLQRMLDHHPNLVLYTEATKLYRAVPALIELLKLGETSTSPEVFAAVASALVGHKPVHEENAHE